MTYLIGTAKVTNIFNENNLTLDSYKYYNIYNQTFFYFKDLFTTVITLHL